MGEMTGDDWRAEGSLRPTSVLQLKPVCLLCVLMLPLPVSILWNKCSEPSSAFGKI